ncbi:MAG: hypothetical protein FWD53_03420, partial [Phycisphaerales bacterium]|nr:hypothetical protein [Phycisphaerales bacterium]
EAHKIIDQLNQWMVGLRKNQGRLLTYASANRAVVEAQVEMGDIAGAKKSAARFFTDMDKSEAYQTIAAAQAKAGDLAEARKSFALTKDARWSVDWADICKIVVQQRLESGGLMGAIEFVANEVGVDWGKTTWEIE